MRGIYEDRRHRALARLEEIAVTKSNLVLQDDELNKEEEVLQAEVMYQMNNVHPPRSSSRVPTQTRR